jgi:hypothetical protein
MATCAQPVRLATPLTSVSRRALLLVVLAVGLPVFAGLVWHQASNNPLWPLLRNSLSLCELHDSSLSPLSPDGLYRAHIVQATYLGRFTETLVFITRAADPWQLTALDPNRAVLEAAGVRSLDAVSWEDTSNGEASVLQLWFTPDAYPAQIHRIDRAWNNVIVKTLASSPAPGADRLDY